MADDIIEIPIVVRDKGLKESIKLTTRLEREINRAVKAAEGQTASQDRLNKVLLSAKREYQGLGVSSQKATAEIRKFAESTRASHKAAKDNARATKEAAEAARKQAREIDRLKGKFVANYGASQKYKKEIRDLIRAKRQGIVTTDQYGDAVQRLKSDFRDIQNGVAQGSNQFAKYNVACSLRPARFSVAWYLWFFRCYSGRWSCNWDGYCCPTYRCQKGR